LLTDTPKLSELIQMLRQNSIERLMTSQRICAQNFGPLLPSYFEPLNVYRCRLYEQCIQLCHEIVHMTIDSVDDCFAPVSTTYAEFIHVMDTELVSLMGLAILVRPGVTGALRTITISQLALSLYLMTQCQTIVLHPLTSLLQTADLIDESFRTVSPRRIFDGPILQLSRKLLVQTIISHCEGQGPMQATCTPTQYPRYPRRRQTGNLRSNIALLVRMGFNLYNFCKSMK